MTLYEYTEVLEEGIRFFKNSSRIEKLADKLKKKAGLLTSPKDRQEINNVVEALRVMALQFKEIEKKNTISVSKVEVKKEYFELEKKYDDIIKIINKETFLNILKKVGGATIIAGTLFISYNFFQEGGFTGALMASQEGKEGEVLKKAFTKEGREAMKTSSSITRGAMSGMADIGSKIKGSKLEGTGVGKAIYDTGKEAEMYLDAEKVNSKMFSGFAGLTAATILGFFNKLFKRPQRSSLYYKTKYSLEKLGKLWH